jgi:hypothetical protein
MRVPSRLIVVRCGESESFKMILNAPDRWPAGTALMVDRRAHERRVLGQQATIERRQRQRRAEPDVMWHTHGFIVVETERLPIQAIQLDATVGN